MIPTIVATNTANKCHACAVTPAGAGQIHKSKPAKTEYPRFFAFAPLPFTKAELPLELAAANVTTFASLLPLVELVFLPSSFVVQRTGGVVVIVRGKQRELLGRQPFLRRRRGNAVRRRVLVVGVERFLNESIASFRVVTN